MRRQDGAQFRCGPLGVTEGEAREEIMGAGHGERHEAFGGPIRSPRQCSEPGHTRTAGVARLAPDKVP